MATRESLHVCADTVSHQIRSRPIESHLSKETRRTPPPTAPSSYITEPNFRSIAKSCCFRLLTRAKNRSILPDG